jgi:hypothetical protein
MKVILFTLISVLTLSTQHLQAQTKQETIDWMKTKLNTYNPCLIYSNYKGKRYESLSFDLFSDLSTINTSRVKFQMEKHSSVEFNWSSITSVTVINAKLIVTFVDNGVIAKARFSDNDYDYNSNNFEFRYWGADTAKEVERFRKAIEHLAVLNGASIIKDDLFND